jgi:hypothetical protein
MSFCFVFTPCAVKNENEKSEKSNILFLTHSTQVDSLQSETTFFGSKSKKKIVVSVHCAYANKDKMARIEPILIYNFIPKVAYLQRLYCVKITKIASIEILTQGHL